MTTPGHNPAPAPATPHEQPPPMRQAAAKPQRQQRLHEQPPLCDSRPPRLGGGQAETPPATKSTGFPPVKAPPSWLGGGSTATSLLARRWLSRVTTTTRLRPAEDIAHGLGGGRSCYKTAHVYRRPLPRNNNPPQAQARRRPRTQRHSPSPTATALFELPPQARRRPQPHPTAHFPASPPQHQKCWTWRRPAPERRRHSKKNM